MENTSIETIMSIVGFGLSVGGFIPLLFLKDRRREVVVIALAAVICFATAWHAIERYRYDRELHYVRGTVLEKLGGGALTYEDIRGQFSDVSSSLVSDALHRMLREKEIKEDVIPVSHNGRSFEMRIYRTAQIQL